MSHEKKKIIAISACLSCAVIVERWLLRFFLWCQLRSLKRRKKKENLDTGERRGKARETESQKKESNDSGTCLKKMVNKTISGRIWQGKQWEQNAGWNNEKTKTSRQRAADAICWCSLPICSKPTGENTILERQVLACLVVIFPRHQNLFTGPNALPLLLLRLALAFFYWAAYRFIFY